MCVRNSGYDVSIVNLANNFEKANFSKKFQLLLHVKEDFSGISPGFRVSSEILNFHLVSCLTSVSDFYLSLSFSTLTSFLADAYNGQVRCVIRTQRQNA